MAEDLDTSILNTTRRRFWGDTLALDDEAVVRVTAVGEDGREIGGGGIRVADVREAFANPVHQALMEGAMKELQRMRAEGEVPQ